ncbi:MAG: DUF1573 domain-containing protein [Lentisphaeria bacterium]|nr:DUF1573 domain-containing protein [Lentisphaeria bacterium]
MHSLILSLSILLLLTAVSCKDKKSPAQPAEAVPSAKETSAETAPVSTFALSYEGILDLGTLYEREERHAEFSVKNVSNEPQTLALVEPTCECIVLDEEKIENVLLQPGEELKVGFIMQAATVHLESFLRNIKVVPMVGKPMTAQVGGRILKPALIQPESILEMEAQKNPAEPWKYVFEIKKNPEMDKPLRFGKPEELPHLDGGWTETGDDRYEMVVTPKAPLPYDRKFVQYLRVPIEEPKEARNILFVIVSRVGEAVNFAPDSWKISRAKLEEAGQFTERFAYGEVPGLQEEKNDGVKDLKNMMKKSLLRQHNAVPLKFVKENHDWDDLFAHLEYEVPAGVSVEKIRHPQGIELRVTVTKEAFAGDVKTVSVVPYRDINRCAPINIQIAE